MDSHDNDQSAANGDLAANQSANELGNVQSSFSTILALLFRRFCLKHVCSCIASFIFLLFSVYQFIVKFLYD